MKIEIGKTYLSEEGHQFEILTSFVRSKGDSIFVSDKDILFFDDGSCFSGDFGYCPDLIAETERELAIKLASEHTKLVINHDRETPSSVFAQLRLWGETVFGQGTPQRLVERAGEEFEELKKEVAGGEWTDKALEEAADIIGVLSRAPGLWDAVVKKMTINCDRKWNVREDGTGYHIPQDTSEMGN